jgi:hypothetical protein
MKLKLLIVTFSLLIGITDNVYSQKVVDNNINVFISKGDLIIIGDIFHFDDSLMIFNRDYFYDNFDSFQDMNDLKDETVFINEGKGKYSFHIWIGSINAMGLNTPFIYDIRTCKFKIKKKKDGNYLVINLYKSGIILIRKHHEIYKIEKTKNSNCYLLIKE